MENREIYELLVNIDYGYAPSSFESQELQSVERIKWHWDSVEGLPKSIYLLKNLKTLDLHGTSVREINDISGLPSLTDLNLSNTLVRDISIVSELKELRNLYLRDTNVSNIDAISGLKKLTGLSLSGTKVTDISALSELISLERINLRGIKVSDISALSKLTSLTYLNLNRTEVSDIGPLLLLTRLNYLSLRGTKVIDISALDEHNALKNLLLGGTQVSDISVLSGMKSLTELDLSGTNVSDISALSGVTSLQTLDLRGLTLNAIPEPIVDLHLDFKKEGKGNSKSKGIYIQSLKLTEQPIEIFSQSHELISEYYRSNGASSPINECKIVFLGAGGAGKSLIIDRLIHDGDFSPDFNGESTPGISIRSKEYLINGEQIELHFWDLGGQAIMHSMHRLFLTNRTLYVVVTNARDNKENEQAWYWIRNIKSFANGAPVLLLVNQKDQNPSANVNITGLKREYNELKEVRIVSALKSTKDEFNNEIRNVICKIVSEMDTVHTPFPKSWLSLMNDLQDMPKDYITSDDFYAKCKRNGIEIEKDILDDIISWYQDLGICFYSRKHPYTSQYMVLKPQWLLNALYILIFNGRQYASNGIIKETDVFNLICSPISGDTIKKVWSNIRYKPFEIAYISNVLLNFELIYRLDQEHFFIPMLCDENEHDAMNGFQEEDTIHISFEYVYLPENVLHCLMVRHGYELNTNIVWRTGAVFERKRCGWKALVRINGNMLDIYVKGEDRDKHPVNSYLDMIRESVYSINRNMGLSADEFIAYREGENEERFEYAVLTGSKEAGLNKIYSKVFKRLIDIDEILGTLISPKDYLTRETVGHMLSALREMGERSVDLSVRSEVELTADFQIIIAPVLNAKYDIQVVREYTLGRSKKKIGETDLYFFRNKDGIKEELYILENKNIEKFTDQYCQLLGYLNPDFIAGFTLSINRNKGWEEAFDYICAKLEQLKSDGGDLAPISIERIEDAKRTQYLKTCHIVPETGMTMVVYHMVLQLSDKDRHEIAIKARK